MKMIAVMIAFFSVSAAQAATYCIATREDVKAGVLGVGEHKDVKWSSHDKKVVNEIRLSNSEKVRFTIETIMTNPDSGIETVKIEGYPVEHCSTRFVFGAEAEGGKMIGEATSCQETESMFVSVLCINDAR